MPSISDQKMDMGEDFVRKKMVKKAFLAVLSAVLAKIPIKTLWKMSLSKIGECVKGR